MVQDNVNVQRQKHMKTKKENLLKWHWTDQHTNNVNVTSGQMKWSCDYDDEYEVYVVNKMKNIKDKI